MPYRKFFRSALLPGILGILAILVLACSGGTGPSSNTNTTPAPDSKQIFRYPIGPSDFGSLDPALAVQNTDISAIQMMFTGLVALSSDGKVTDQLASNHTISSDGLTYTFTLRPNLTFSDGTPLTANDVAYSINRALLPSTKSPAASFLSPIKDFTKIISGQLPTLIDDSLIVKDDHTISIILAQPTAYFLQSLAALPTAYTVNKKVVEKYGAKWTEHLSEGGGAGPFKASSYSHNKGLTLTPNTNYYGPKPRLQRVELQQSGSTDTTYKSYQAGQLDYATIPLADLANARKRPDYKHTPTLGLNYVLMNYLAKPFNNIKIRQAFALAINKDILAQNVMYGSVLPTNHLIPQGVPGYNQALAGPASVTSTKGDLQKAKQLFQEGLQEENYQNAAALPSITLSYLAGSNDTKNLVTVLAQQWQTAFGVNMQVSSMEASALVQAQLGTTGKSGPLQIWTISYGNYADPQAWLSTWFAKGAPFNNANYGQNTSSNATQQQAIQSELAQADVNQNQQERLQQYSSAEQHLVDDVAAIPLYQVEAHVLINPKLQNYSLNPLVTIAPNDWGNIYMSL
ncbi:peptide ABC transporter substrate-binding protein [Ktedonobacter sp. SOSP1-52]|uniref:peptide ABC transporter substrate-binding protein n=1 Tax=Ktedonobacter sp. SOSP1-52 TaxID=2778366 RepID=UPI001915AAEC|nr:peptide ABC transporter substrate-binding protein [Ktedonobacter sp. SOSP1-52]GHO65227.1 peptide ABC transporter substrate-binding protein [Ktedonobacter sp. SOSP1-52]